MDAAYENNLAKTAGSAIFPANSTLRSNLDRQIEEAEKRIAALRETKARLEKSNLLDTQIADLQQAMRW